MKEPLIHIMIIWSKGLSLEKTILADVSTHFKLLNIFRMKWEEHLFPENLKRFYAHSQKDKNEEDYNRIIENKIQHCGNEAFTVIIFEDLSPDFSERKTLSGLNLVNVNVYDRKAEYRLQLGGGHQIHASDNYFETNKDLALLLGCCVDDFKSKYPTNQEKLDFHRNIIGVPKWTDFNEFFFVLNNCIKYVVLRNFENLPEQHVVASHGDVDLLVEDLNYVKYLTGAQSVFPNDSHRVHYLVNFKNEQVPFDFRFLGDNYYDIKWQLNILKNRVFHKKSFYIPDEKNHFFALLYHAYIQKRKLASDYKTKLKTSAEKIGEDYTEDSSDFKIFGILNNFMVSQGYEFVLPQDISVFFNKKFIEKNTGDRSQKEAGILVSSTVTRTANDSFITEVYKTDDIFLKIATNPVCENEYNFLKTLEIYEYFPSIISVEYLADATKVKMNAINGIAMKALNNESSFWKLEKVIKFIVQSIDILSVLLKHNIAHRDIRLSNLLVEKVENGFCPRLFDFGWSAYLNDKNPVTPIGLGHKSKWKGDGFSDAYSMGISLEAKFGRINCIKPIINQLLEISPQNYKQPEKLRVTFEELKKDCRDLFLKITVRDRIFLMVKRIKAIQLNKT